MAGEPSTSKKKVKRNAAASSGRFVDRAAETGRSVSKASKTAKRTTAGTRSSVAEKKIGAVGLGAVAGHHALLVSFVRELEKRDPDGTLLGEADLQQAAALAADRILDSSLLWVKQLGAFYDTEGVRTLLARGREPVSRQAVSKRKSLLALTTGSGRVVYPAFQFQGRTPISGLDKVLEVLPETLVSRWTVASWLTSPEVALDGERPIDVLANDGPAGRQRVAEVAARWSAQLAN
jgi:hypothetical protein